MTEQPAKTGSAPTPHADVFSSRDILTGHLAALLNGLPQHALEAAADGLIGLGWRPAADPSVTEEALIEHSFMEDDDGDGWNEPRSYCYSCSCTKAEYASWTQRDPEMTGLSAFLEEGRYDAMALHHTHVAEVLLTAGGGVARSR